MLKLIPRHHISTLDQEHGTGRPAGSFSRWHPVGAPHLHADHFPGQSAGWSGGLESPVYQPLSSGSQAGGPLHLCRRHEPASCRLFRGLVRLMYQCCPAHAPRYKFKFKNKLYPRLCGSLGHRCQKMVLGPLSLSEISQTVLIPKPVLLSGAKIA